jgi:hypothetical protein
MREKERAVCCRRRGTRHRSDMDAASTNGQAKQYASHTTEFSLFLSSMVLFSFALLLGVDHLINGPSGKNVWMSLATMAPGQ